MTFIAIVDSNTLLDSRQSIDSKVLKIVGYGLIYLQIVRDDLNQDEINRYSI
jgi:hypothetical protein